MKPQPRTDHHRASIIFYYVVALNTRNKDRCTINRSQAARVLANLLNIHPRGPHSWLRGDFRKHPVSRENFLRFVRKYRNLPGLESPREIKNLAIDLYGMDYRRTLDLLDPQDIDTDTTEDDPAIRKSSRLITSICKLIKACSQEELTIFYRLLLGYHWSADQYQDRVQGR